MWLYLTSDAFSRLIDSLLENMCEWLDKPLSLEEKIRITDEAHQYLNGAHALFAASASENDEGLADGQTALLEHLLENAHAAINEQQERFRDRRNAWHAAMPLHQPAALQ